VYIKLGLEVTSKSYEDLHTTSNIHEFWSGEYYVKIDCKVEMFNF
jgi:hypothetical protein